MRLTMFNKRFGCPFGGFSVSTMDLMGLKVLAALRLAGMVPSSLMLDRFSILLPTARQPEILLAQSK